MAKNYITAAMDGLEELLLASETFTESTGLDSQEEIRDKRIHWGLVEVDTFRSKEPRPLAVINDTEAMGWNKQTQSYGSHMSAAGSVELYLAADTKHPKDHKRSLRAFQDWAGHVIQEIALKNGEGSHYAFDGIAHATPCQRSPRSEDANYDFFWVLVELTFDAGGAG